MSGHDKKEIRHPLRHQQMDLLIFANQQGTMTLLDSHRIIVYLPQSN